MKQKHEKQKSGHKNYDSGSNLSENQFDYKNMI